MAGVKIENDRGGFRVNLLRDARRRRKCANYTIIGGPVSCPGCDAVRQAKEELDQMNNVTLVISDPISDHFNKGIAGISSGGIRLYSTVTTPIL